MEGTNINQSILPLYGTDSLCFDKNEFMKSKFNVDTFVQVHQASGCGGLETLRDDLGIYLKILRSAMIDLINRDYADFVNLSTNLTGLDRLIETLKAPLGQLREEVLSVERLISETIESVSEDLNRRRVINQQKALLHRLNQISIRLERLENLLQSESVNKNDDANNDLVNRLATEVNHLNFLVAQCEGASLLNKFKPRVESVCNFVEVGLERGLNEGFKENDPQLLVKTLRTYASLGTIPHAHQQLRTIIQSHLEEVISDSALKNDPRGLRGLYEKTISTIKKVCAPLITISMGARSDVISGFSFYEKSIWPEILTALETRTHHIFNPGNPDAFRERYLESVKFLDTFEELLVTPERIMKFRQEEDYKKFWDQWNLPVYFQIRYQEIGQVMESSLSGENCGLNACPSGSDFQLHSTRVVWESLLKCFSSEIFLVPLLHRFWKLVLLILSRHRTWIHKTTVQIRETKPSKAVSGQSSSEDISSLNSALYLLCDINKLATNLENYFQSTIDTCISHLELDKKNVIKETLQHQIEKLLKLKDGLSEGVIENLKGNMFSPLKQVSETPRLYRRTNRALPSSNQQYINTALQPLVHFNEKAKNTIHEKELRGINIRVITATAVQYETVTREVLISVQKMEESLRRLKRARDRGAQQGADSSSGPSDDYKIRAQIHLDVLFFGETIYSLELDCSSIEPYKKLLNLVENAKEGKQIT